MTFYLEIIDVNRTMYTMKLKHQRSDSIVLKFMYFTQAYPYIRRGNENNCKSTKFEVAKPSAINCKPKQCNFNGADSCLTVTLLPLSHLKSASNFNGNGDKICYSNT